ncbi:MAG: hypothetical protein K0S53_2646 [Bacteroidetes bacterium]|jgi:hypothetical protein|nr:hypothetical protein [Bacteroidota bacterium]
MTNKKTVLAIGIDPKWIDFSSPEFAAMPGLTAEKVTMGIQGSIKALNELGYEAELCWTDLGDTAIDVLKTHLLTKSFDCVLIGAGIRKPDSNFTLFENMINSVHEYAPKARICFNTNPMDTVASVQRWV